MKNETLSFKCELFFAKNWKYIFWGLILAVIVIAYELTGIKSQMKRLENVIYENNSKVVLTTSDGRAIKVTKTPLKAEYLEKYAVSIIVNSFVVSRSQITQNFEKNNIREYKDVLENSKSLGNIYLNYLNLKDKDSVGQFISYIQWLISAIAQDKLPEFINIANYNVNSFEFNENKFKLDLSINVIAQSYILAKGEYKTEKGQIRIKATGDFDLSRSSDENPYGMYILSFNIEPITKGKMR